MDAYSRRNFIQLTMVASAGVAIARSGLSNVFETPKGSNIGVYAVVEGRDVEGALSRIKKLGFSSCELYTDYCGLDMAESLKTAIAKYNIKVEALFSLGPGPTSWDFYEGQKTIGLVCREFRQDRIKALMELSDLAKLCGVEMIETHVGFIPENPNDPNYSETVHALKEVVGHCEKNGQTFLYHAGQETPTTLLRTILDVGYANQGIGMDTANLIMYDRGHPFHALDVYGKYVKLVNAKDGLYPTDPRNLGKEVQLGSGKVEFPSFINKLIDIGYTGPIIIERENVLQEEWERDVIQSKEFLCAFI